MKQNREDASDEREAINRPDAQNKGDVFNVRYSKSKIDSIETRALCRATNQTFTIPQKLPPTHF